MFRNGFGRLVNFCHNSLCESALYSGMPLARIHCRPERALPARRERVDRQTRASGKYTLERIMCFHDVTKHTATFNSVVIILLIFLDFICLLARLSLLYILAILQWAIINFNGLCCSPLE